jgi:thiol-disulfide isomerase/thioredoxin
MKTLVLVLSALVLAGPSFAVGTHLKRERPLTIAQGEKVELKEFLVTGLVTVFAFTSEYCEPCRHYDETLYTLHSRLNKVAVVKVDINRPEVHRIDWGSPVAEQYGIHELPWFKICGPDGRLLLEGDAARALVDSWIGKLH